MNTITIQNQLLRAVISENGAEPISLRYLPTDTELLWQADPAFWPEHAPILFPICGRLLDGEYTHQGTTYHMGLHGFARTSHFETTDHSAAEVAFSLLSDDKTKVVYPFDFRLTVTYRLIASRFQTVFTVENLGNELIPFSLGAHPGFNLPLLEGEAFESYHIAFDTPTTPQKLLLTPEGLHTGTTSPFPLKEQRILPLTHEMFDAEDSLFFTAMPSSLTLCGPSLSLRLSYEGFPYLGFWRTPSAHAPYLCIEPWHGTPSPCDHPLPLLDKPDMIHLSQRSRISLSYSITVESHGTSEQKK